MTGERKYEIVVCEGGEVTTHYADWLITHDNVLTFHDVDVDRVQTIYTEDCSDIDIRVLI